MQTIKMHLKLSPWILIVLLLAALVPFSQSQSLPFSSDFLQFSETRLKRQLFRGDIPNKRPLSGNVQATELGFPLPGRWSDGKSNTINIRPGRPFQEYIDMLDGARVSRYNKATFKTNSYKSNNNNGGFGANNFGGGGGANKESYKVKDVGVYDAGFGDDGGNGYSAIFGDPVPPDKGFDNEDEEPINHHHHEDSFQPPPTPSYDFPNKHQSQPVSYGERHPQTYPEGPKTFIHYHPVQYSPVLNFEGPDPLSQSYGPPEPPNKPHSHGHSTSYGPPNHVSGEPLGLVEGGFVPSLGVHGNDHYNNKQPEYHQAPAPDPPYRFDPFKNFPSRNQGFQTESPVALPILAQFHSSKPIMPIKVTKLKEPIQIILRHQPHHNHNPHPHPRPPPPRQYGYMRRIPRFFNFMRRPKLHHPPPPPFPPQGPPDWFYENKKK